ncbi:MAG: UDP-N-acetylmuramate--L-alanine ligase [Clostridiales bacterium]|nr:UDP-N-acetylmuramate--L-alanine ligase [Clostridiales bacterium]
MGDMKLEELKKNGRVYFVGIGGISMSGLALLTKGYGFTVGGSDNHPSERTQMLAGQGITIYNNQEAENIDDYAPDYIVKTAAILPHNKELARAIEKNIPVFDRSEFLGIMTNSYKNVINISGTHGKTTTTSMTSMMLIDAGLDPTIHLGAPFDGIGGSVKLGGNKDLLISEACEFKRSFLEFRSTTAAITNIDHDHVDCYPTLDDVIDVFAQFINKIDDGGYLVVTGTDGNIRKSIERSNKNIKVITCAADGSDADFKAENIEYNDGLPAFDIRAMGENIGRVQLLIPGSHNISNALIAAACAYLNGAPAESIIKALNEFGGADGRFTVKGTYKGCEVVVDYAHHPTAARVTIDAAMHMPHNNLLVVFQPLTYNRVELLFDEYVESLLTCPKVLFSEIFTDREVIHEGMVSSKDIADAINRRGGNAEFYADKEDLKRRIDELITPGDMILILGPEDIRELGNELCPGGDDKADV